MKYYYVVELLADYESCTETKGGIVVNVDCLDTAIQGAKCIYAENREKLTNAIAVYALISKFVEFDNQENKLISMYLVNVKKKSFSGVVLKGRLKNDN